MIMNLFDGTCWSALRLDSSSLEKVSSLLGQDDFSGFLRMLFESFVF